MFKDCVRVENDADSFKDTANCSLSAGQCKKRAWRDSLGHRRLRYFVCEWKRQDSLIAMVTGWSTDTCH